MAFSSAEFYGGSLRADASVAAHRLCELPGVRAEPLTEAPVQFIDTAGAGYDEEREPDGESRLNPQEAALVGRKVRALLDAGVRPEDVAVIAPYAAQVRRLRELLPVAGLEIDSVDGFQGREKEAVVLSLVRSNTENEIGFLADVRRTNVALTRARRKLIVVGDSATLSVLPFYRRLVRAFRGDGGVSYGVGRGGGLTPHPTRRAASSSSRRTNAACSGLANPCCAMRLTAARSPRTSAAASSHSPGRTSLRYTPSAPGARRSYWSPRSTNQSISRSGTRQIRHSRTPCRR